VIVSSDAIISVKVLSQKLEIFLTADGQVQLPLFYGHEIRVQRSSKSVRLVRLANSSFFRTLRQKLHWSGSSVK
jgi:NAD kinase